MSFRTVAMARLAALGLALVVCACSDDDGGSSSDGGGAGSSAQDGGGSGSGGSGGKGGSGATADGGGAKDGGSGSGGTGSGGTGSGGTGGSGAVDDAIEDGVCDGVDGDHDGQVDEGYSTSDTHCGRGECRASGTLRCVDGDEVDDCKPAKPATSDASCNGEDDDCNGEVDEDFEPEACDGDDSDLCEEGETACDDGDIACDDDTSDLLDVCDGLDNDCDDDSADGSEDPADGDDCDGNDGDHCDEGTYACVGGDLVCSDESSDDRDVCNDTDDDCDSASDDGDEDPLLNAACDGGDSDHCNEGTYACNGTLTCSDTTGSTLDLCDGTDEDCDSASADGSEELAFGTACDSAADSDLCTDGTNVCSGGPGLACNDSTPSLLDECDGLDNDCDSASADGSEDPLLNTDCDGPDSDLCQEGTYATCVDTDLVCSDATGSTLDTCDGADDDCDPASADGSEDARVGVACDSSADSDLCEDGMTVCSGGSGVTCNDTAANGLDLCDGLDNDCDAGSADGSEDPGLGTVCDGTDDDLCTDGVLVCSGVSGLTCNDDAASVLDDDCDGVDDDCDGSTDEAFVSQASTCGTGACARMGMTTCSAGGVDGDTCVSGTPADDDTSCDDVDDDCDGSTDEGFVGCMDGDTTAVCVDGGVVAGDDCDDPLPCTVDACLVATGQCESVNHDELCPDDGFSCTHETCSPGATADADGCVAVREDQVCLAADGQFCNGPEICDPSAVGHDVTTGCIDSLPQNVPCLGDLDGWACTDTVCIEDGAGAGHCASQPDHASCGADGLVCDGVESCAPGAGADANGCRATPDVVCAAVPACAITTCVEPGTSCSKSANLAYNCSDGDPCTTDSCNPNANPASNPSGCLHGAPDPGCVGCTTDLDCADSFACTADHCGTLVAGQCHHDDTACECFGDFDCDDGFDCSRDTCGADGQCDHFDNDAACVAADAPAGKCDGDDVCDPANSLDTSGCVLDVGPAPDCDDGLDCTSDQCFPDVGCVVQPDDAQCDQYDLSACDGPMFCNGDAPNNLSHGCEQSGVPVVCPGDGITCTQESCVEPAVQGGRPVCVTRPDTDYCLAQPGGCGTTCQAGVGCTRACNIAKCQGKTYQCGDCVDNDGDCRVDSGYDTACLGPCANSETTYHGDIPGQNNAPCKMDCYFDQDTGHGNDDCFWDHGCDPVSVAPSYPPEGNSSCAYSANTNIAGSSLTCAQAFVSQSTDCWDPTPGATPGVTGTDYCGDLVPNGCDCFGCCDIPGVDHDVYLGSEANGSGSCTPTTLNDPTKCKACTQVPACTNTCGSCEICVGRDLPPECGCQVCPAGAQLCGAPCGTACPTGFFCNTGCCAPVPT